MANNVFRITELDFDSIRNNLKDYLRNQSEFTDFDFEGSGMAVLLDLLAYNTHYMSFYNNMLANEMFMDTAQLRNSIISHAKLMNYKPTGRRAPIATVNITVTPGESEDDSVQTLTLNKHVQFLTEPVDGITYSFVNTESQTEEKNEDGSFVFQNVELKQGEVTGITYIYDTTNDKRRFTIPSANTDLDSIEVTVQESVGNTTSWTYTQATDLTEVKANSYVYFLEENSDSNGSYTIYFGDGIIGNPLANGNLVYIQYIDTLGEEANKSNNFTMIQSIGEFSANVIVDPVTAAAGGAPKETIEQIRFRAPIHYTVQNRAVTVDDYKSLLLKDYPYIRSVIVWGGEENDPPVYGKVFMSLNPVDNYEITVAEKELIKADVLANRSVLTIIPEIVDPNYIYLMIRSTFQYDSNKTNLDAAQLESLVRQQIIDFRDEDLQQFDTTFRKSLLARAIDSTHKSIISNSLKVYLQKRLEPTLGESKNYTMNYDTPLYKGTITDKLYSYPTVTVKDLAGVDRLVYFEEVPESYTGVDSIDVVTPGSEYTSTPDVTITGDGTGATATAKIINGKLNSVTITNKGSNYTRATVTITGGDGSGASAVAVLEGRLGTLRTFYYKSTGEKVIVNSEAGTIDYDAGEIQLINFNPSAITTNAYYPNDVLTFNIIPYEDIIAPFRNRILDIDANDGSSILIEAEAE